MITFDLEQENLEKLIEDKREEIEHKLELQQEDEEQNIVYPLFRNYPNGTPDYYLKLKSTKFSNWKNELRILFIDKTIMGDKYYKLLKNLGCKIVKQSSQNKVSNYNLIISNDANKTSELMTDVNTIYINCVPRLFDKKNSLFYFDNKKQLEKYSYYLYSNEVQYLYRKNSTDFIDAISKIKETK